MYLLAKLQSSFHLPFFLAALFLYCVVMSLLPYVPSNYHDKPITIFVLFDFVVFFGGNVSHRRKVSKILFDLLKLIFVSPAFITYLSFSSNCCIYRFSYQLIADVDVWMADLLRGKNVMATTNQWTEITIRCVTT